MSQIAAPPKREGMGEGTRTKVADEGRLDLGKWRVDVAKTARAKVYKPNKKPDRKEKISWGAKKEAHASRGGKKGAAAFEQWCRKKRP